MEQLGVHILMNVRRHDYNVPKLNCASSISIINSSSFYEVSRFVVKKRALSCFKCGALCAVINAALFLSGFWLAGLV